MLALNCAALTNSEDRPWMAEQVEQLPRWNDADVLDGTAVRQERWRDALGEAQHLVDARRPGSPNIIAVCQDITEHKESEERLAAELADTELLRDLCAQLIGPDNEQALHEKIVDAVATIMRSDFATMQMFCPKRGPKGELHLLVSRGLTPEAQKLWEWVRFETDSTCGHALRTGSRAVAADVETSLFLAGTHQEEPHCWPRAFVPHNPHRLSRATATSWA